MSFIFHGIDFSPILHAWLDLNLLVTREHDSNMDISGVRFFLPQEVVDSGLYVGSQSGCLQLLGRVFVVLPVGSSSLVTGITLKPDNIDVSTGTGHRQKTYSLHICSK